ncbi:MAG: hypothetical protein QXL94_01570 [Candidatus Parvarchaeum sp.]
MRMELKSLLDVKERAFTAKRYLTCETTSRPKVTKNYDREIQEHSRKIITLKQNLYRIGKNELGENILRINTKKFVSAYFKKVPQSRAMILEGGGYFDYLELFPDEYRTEDKALIIRRNGEYFKFPGETEWYVYLDEVSFSCGCGDIDISGIIPYRKKNRLYCGECNEEIEVILWT